MKYKQNASVNFLVRAKLTIHTRRRRRQLRRINVKHYKHPDIHRKCLIICLYSICLMIYIDLGTNGHIAKAELRTDLFDLYRMNSVQKENKQITQQMSALGSLHDRSSYSHHLYTV